MSAVSDAIINAFGKGESIGSLQNLFTQTFDKMLIENVVSDINYGWFKNRFYLLLSSELENCKECVNEWNFLIPKDGKTRTVFGRNAYGAIFMLEDVEIKGTAAQVGILNPFIVSYTSDEHCVFMNNLGYWMPKNAHHFSASNSAIYDSAFGKSTFLNTDEILAPKIPEPLGGKFEMQNFQVEPIIDYYKSTAKIYKQIKDKNGNLLFP